jgi:hypothetical protein
MRKLVAPAALALSFFLWSPVFSQNTEATVTDKPGWHKLGDVSVNFAEKNESSVVFAADKFKALKLRVTDAPVTIARGTVFYESGDTEELLIDRELTKDQETGAFILRPAESLHKVSFRLKATPEYRHEKAQIEIYGLK